MRATPQKTARKARFIKFSRMSGKSPTLFYIVDLTHFFLGRVRRESCMFLRSPFKKHGRLLWLGGKGGPRPASPRGGHRSQFATGLPSHLGRKRRLTRCTPNT